MRRQWARWNWYLRADVFEVFITILIFLLVILLTAVVFAGWVIVTVLRFSMNAVRSAGRLIFRGVTPAIPRARKVRQIVCHNPACGAANPSGARFCRRCGSPVQVPTKVIVRRAAVFF